MNDVPHLELLTQTKPQVANLKPPTKTIDGNKDTENDSTHRAVATAQKIVKKPVTVRSDAVGGVTQSKVPIGNTTKPLRLVLIIFINISHNFFFFCQLHLNSP